MVVYHYETKGIKVIDFTGVQAGPVCTQFLAWYGADVLTVERINGGDVDASVFQLPAGTE
jgi:crotonobetainyl-CoA:carnitine CoA-transferase CaiB-like acyl-CoA transferase